MSSLATSATGHVATAFEFREIFLRTGVAHKDFSCPFCGALLIDKCIVPVKPCVKAPHFALPPETSHAHWCEPFEIDVIGPAAAAPPKVAKTRVLLRDVELPEALVPRRIPQVIIPVPGGPSWRKPDESSARRVKTSLTGAALPQRQTTSLLRNITDAYEEARLRVSRKATAEGKTGDAFWKALDEELTGFPLKLYDEQLSYSTAFRSTAGVVRDARIYHGYRGVVERDGTSLVIREFLKGSSTDPEDPLVRPSFVVEVPEPEPHEPAWLRKFRNDLVGWSKSGATVRWFCLGQAARDPAGPVLAPASLDAIYAYEAKPPRK